nr:helicase-related protein [Plantibacter sp. CFBP 8775]
MAERFSEWVWEDPARATQLADEYNRRFNAIVLRDYSAEGEYLSLPGIAATFKLRPHQRAAIARAIAEPTAGLFHGVGAGKTAEMVASAMELKRMGLIRKPAIVVPNHMLAQFSREWMQIYPQARILAASSKDLAGDKRRLFVARAATNDWDAIIMTRTAFEKVPLSPAAEAEYITAEVDAARASLAQAQGEDRMSVKRIERTILTMENQQKKLLDKPRDPGLTFESTGIDYLIVDEMHDYKNLNTPSNIQDAAITPGAQRASDLHSKLQYLRSQPGEHVAIGATATPIANSITEAYVMQRFLRPDLLRNAGIDSFDAWAATFGKTVTEMEMSPTGSFRLKTRFAKFQNVPEMLRMWHVFADVKTPEQLNLPVPLIRVREDGQRRPEIVTIPPTPELQRYVTQLGERADDVAARKVRPEEDNMLKISTDGRKGALDMRMVDEHAIPSGPTKIRTVAQKVMTEWRNTRDLTFVDDEGTISPARGGLQLVFSDLGTPSQRWNAYDEIKLTLIELGMPADRIRFIHEAKNDTEKARLFAAAKAGHVDVLLGSTSKMGVGTNIQARMTAMHDVDCPWRPADVEQRHGRGIRQGNQNPEIGVYQYVVEGSFDAYMWQTVERKAKFIGQIMRGTLDAREIDDIGDAALSAAETKALASGNPLILEQSVASNDVARFERLQRVWHRNQSNLVAIKAQAIRTMENLEGAITGIEAALPRIIDTSGDAFAMAVRDLPYRSRTDAAAAIQDWARTRTGDYLAPNSERAIGELGHLGGFTLDARITKQLGTTMIGVQLRDVPGAGVSIPRGDLLESGMGFIRMLENRIATLPRLLQQTTEQHQAACSNLADAEANLGTPFKHANDLTEAKQRLASVEAQITDSATNHGPAAAPATAATAPTAANPRVVDSELVERVRRINTATPAANEETAPTSTPPRRGWPSEPQRERGRQL